MYSYLNNEIEPANNCRNSKSTQIKDQNIQLCSFNHLTIVSTFTRIRSIAVVITIHCMNSCNSVKFDREGRDCRLFHDEVICDDGVSGARNGTSENDLKFLFDAMKEDFRNR
jgi:hypothetical protein